jgi:hypothetical protein
MLGFVLLQISRVLLDEGLAVPSPFFIDRHPQTSLCHVLFITRVWVECLERMETQLSVCCSMLVQYLVLVPGPRAFYD